MGWATSTGTDFVMFIKDTASTTVRALPGTLTTWVGTVSGTTINNLVLKAGTEPVGGYPSGENSVVIATPTAAWNESLVAGLLVEHLQTGAHDPAVIALLAGTQTFTGNKTFSGTNAFSGVTNFTAAVTRDSFPIDWWEEIGRTTIGTAGDSISVASLTAKKYLKVLFSVTPSGVLAPYIRFNNDTGNNYNYRYLVNYATASGALSQDRITADPGSLAQKVQGELFIVNTTSEEKIVSAHIAGASTAGAGNQATSIEVTAKWANTAAAISRVDLLNSGAGDFAIGSQMIVLGHD